MKLMFNNQQDVANWIYSKWGNLLPWFFAVGILDNEGVIKGAVTFHNFNGSNIELCYFGPNSFTKEVLRGIATFVFGHLKVQRLTISIPRKNKKLREKLPRIGFKVEGVLRHFYGPYHNDDAIVYGILASEGKKYVDES